MSVVRDLGRYRPYPAYRDSGVEWLGEVPEGWEVRRLKRVVSFVGGGTPSTELSEYWGGDIPWVSPKDMRTEQVTGSVDSLTDAGLSDSPCRLVPGGSVLVVVRSGILRRTIPVAVNVIPVALNQDMKALVPGPLVDGDYLCRVISGHSDALLTVWRKQGATVESIEYELVAGTPVPLPPLPEQRAIASFLDRETTKIDALVEKKERLLELLDEQRAALISRAVTKGLDPDVPMKDSGVEWLGEVPEGWEVVKPRSLFSQVKQQGFPNRCVLSVYREFGVVERESREDNQNRRPEDLNVYQLVLPGDLVINKMKAWQGSVGMANRDGITSPDYLVYRPISAEVTAFCHYLFRSHSVRSVFMVNSNGIRPGQWRLEPRRFERLDIPLPPLPEQKAIAAYLDRETARIDALKAKVQHAIDLLKEYRTALISAAVTGRIDVRDRVPEDAA